MSQESSPSDRPGATDAPSPLDENIKRKSTWLRLFFMIVFVFLYGVAELVTAAVVLIQFFWVLLTGTTNEPLRQLGQSLATYTYQIFLYLTYNSEQRPFPFDALWPQGPPQSPPPAAPHGAPPAAPAAGPESSAPGPQHSAAPGGPTATAPGQEPPPV
jgi:hypothetical protein